jgi:hypothetical protein
VQRFALSTTFQSRLGEQAQLGSPIGRYPPEADLLCSIGVLAFMTQSSIHFKVENYNNYS